MLYLIFKLGYTLSKDPAMPQCLVYDSITGGLAVIWVS